VFIGGNDIHGILQLNGDLVTKIEDVLYKDDYMIEAIVQGMNDLYDLGARNFLFLNLPSALITPLGLAATTDFLVKDFADQFIGTYLNKLRTQASDQFGIPGPVNITYGNFYGCLQELAIGKYGGFYGFSQTTTQCIANRLDPNTTICADPNATVFWDNQHPTTAFHRFMANLTLELMMGNTDGCLSTSCVEYSLSSSCFVGGTSPLALLVGISVGILLFLVIVVGCGIYYCVCGCEKCKKKIEDEKEVEYSELQ